MWNITHASSQGLMYFHEGRNNQDVVSSWTDGQNCLAIINDGCHGQMVTHNEVGAINSNRYLYRKGIDLLLSGLRPGEFPSRLFPDYIDYLYFQTEAQLLDSPEDINEYIANYLMCTTLGFVANKDEVCVFWAGDGVVYLNNSVYRELRSNESNMPTYPAYWLYERYGMSDEIIKGLLPNGFQSVVIPAEAVQTIGITSDGLLDKTNLIEELKAHSKTRMSLQMCLNRISVLRTETSDNVSVAFAERKEP